MVIFHSYVSLPEGTQISGEFHWEDGLQHPAISENRSPRALGAGSPQGECCPTGRNQRLKRNES